jgi:ribosomal protein S18 acetylase RimI-like enzyme
MSSAYEKIPDTLVTTYLEMTDKTTFISGFVEIGAAQILTLQTPDVGFYRFLYKEVGEKWRWRDRLVMPEADLMAILTDARNSVDTLMVGGVPAGYVELQREGDDTEIAYFGLREAFFGRGLGKHLLSYGIQKAWDDGAKRVWVHTCNLDGPRALDNYRARGFSVYDVREQPMPERYL